MSKSKNSKQVYDYLKRISRPEIVQGFVNNLETCKKADVTKALEVLVDEGRVVEKLCGKSKIYYLNQKELRKGIKENGGELDQKIMDKSEALKSIENGIREKETELKAFDGKLTRSEVKEEQQRLVKRLDDVERELEKSTTKKTEKENKSKNYDHEFVSKECRKRKRIAKDIINGLEEVCIK